jgi:uncharacterized protein (DUF305 family)
MGLALILALALALAACGEDEEQARETDGAFIAEMVPHHESAIEMAEVAQEQAEHPEIKQLADAIIETQAAEINDLSAAHERLFDMPVDEADHGTMGMSEEDTGMGMDELDMKVLEDAKPFDQEFIDMMVPHHQGAIRMARVELAMGQDAELKEMAQMIVDAQSKEIEQMNEWRARWYGEPSPAGGVPAEEDLPEDHESMGH